MAETLRGRFASQVLTNLGANLLQGLLGIALIPLATRVLGPEDYGTYGLAVVVASLVVALCETGATYVLYGHFAEVAPAEQRRLFSTLLVLAAGAGTLAGLTLWVFWPVVGLLGSILTALTPLEIILVCITVPCRSIWAIANPILIAQRRSVWVAACVSLQAITAFCTVLATLFLFEQGRASLFWGNMAGAAICVIFALGAIGRSAWAAPRLHWLKQILRMAPAAWFAGVADNFRATVESSVVARAAGSVGLGNYSHARLYHGLLMQGTNAFANVLWPLALQDARARSTDFLHVRLAWNVVYLCLTVAGLVFVFYGEYVVYSLTNGKFDQAAGWVPFLVVYLLIQNAGKPATAVLYAANRGNVLSGVRIVSTVAAVIALGLLVPTYGVPAALAICIGEMSLMRVLVQIWARRIQPIPFQDQWVLGGCAVIGGGWLLVHSISFEPGRHLALFTTICIVLLMVAGRSLRGQARAGTLGQLRALIRK